MNMVPKSYLEQRNQDLEQRLSGEQIKNQKLIVENARLSAEYRKFAILVEFGKKIAIETQINKLLLIIMQQTREILNADRCTLFLVDYQRCELWSKIAHDLESLAEIRIPLSQGIAGIVATSGNLINIRDAYSDPRFNPKIDTMTGYKTHTILCAPMRNAEGIVTGVFQVLNKKNGIFAPEDEELLTILASQTAIAVENTLLLEAQHRTFDSFVKTLAATIDARDPITAGHSYRVMRYCTAIGRILELDEDNHEILRYSALLHDLGKIGVRESVLCKPGRLTPEEYRHIQKHVVYTEEILKKIYFSKKFEILPFVAGGHHEKFDGSGYPRGVKGSEIHFLSRVMAVSDVFDAITFKRHYRDPMPIEDALSILNKDTGSHFDPDCVKAFMQISLDELVRIGEPENSEVVRPQDIALFSHFTIQDFYDMLRYSEKTAEEQHICDLFNHYYTQRLSTNFTLLDDYSGIPF